MSEETPTNGTAEAVQEASDQVTNIAEAKKPTKQELARQKIYEERRQRHINKGVSPDIVDQVIAQEDYERLPTEEKLKRIDRNVGAAFRQMAGEMQNLRHNDGQIAEAMDVNFRALGKILTKLGIEPDEQRAFLKEAYEDINREREAAQRAQAEQEAAAAEKAVATQVLKEDHQGEAVPAPAPEGATNFGG